MHEEVMIEAVKHSTLLSVIYSDSFFEIMAFGSEDFIYRKAVKTSDLSGHIYITSTSRIS